MHAHKVNSCATKLYPSYGASFSVSYFQCMLMTVFSLWLVASQSICLPSFVLRGNAACASNSLNPKLCQMTPPYLPICGISMLFQVNLHVPTLIFKMPLMKQQGMANIFHARYFILMMSVYSLVIA